MKLYLIDGTYELFRAHFGVPSRTAPDGREVGATYGIVASTLSLLAETEVTHVAASFDSVVESFRNEVFSGYKTGEGIEQDLLDQFPLAERAMRAIGVTVWSMYDYEADDGLATGARRWVDDVEQVVVMSPDKDLCQLYDDPRIVGYDRRKGLFIDRDAVVVPEGSQFSQPQGAGQGAGFVRNTFHQASVTQEHPGAVIDDFVPAAVEAVGQDLLFHLPPLLGVDGQGRDRARLQALHADRLAGIFTIPVTAVVNALERLFNLSLQFAVAVTRA